MRIGEAFAQTVFIGGHRNKMNMIGHETVAPDLRLGPARRFAEKIKVERIVHFFKEDSTAPVSTLGDMVGQTGDSNSR